MVEHLDLKACLYVAYPASLQALHLNTLKQIIQIQHKRIKDPNWQEATSGLLTIVAKDLNLGRPRTNPVSGQSGTRTQDHQIVSPVCWPLSHTASIKSCNQKVIGLTPLSVKDPPPNCHFKFQFHRLHN